MTDLYVLAATAFAVTLGSTPLVRRLSWKLNLLDRPTDGPHKSHLEAIPYGGGVAIACGLLASGVVVPFAETAGSLVVAGLVILILGLVDDWRGSPPLIRLLLQLLVAAGISFLVPACRFPLAESILPVQLAATALFITAVTNAFNFLDNMDGLAAGLGSIVLLFLGIYAVEIGYDALAFLCVGLAAALAGFLVFNFPPARIFMGDAGGLFIGFVVGTTTVALIRQAHLEPAIEFEFLQLTPLLTLTVPFYDFFSVIAIRLCHRSFPWIGDHNHISHRLVRCGMSRRTAVLTIYAFAVLTSLPILFVGAAPYTAQWILGGLVPGLAVSIAAVEISCTQLGSRSGDIRSKADTP